MSGTGRTRAPGRPRRESTDAAIDAATRSLLAEVGYADLTIEAVARRAGVGKPTVYRRHRSKPALVAAALVATLEAANPEPPTSDDVAADLRQLLANLAAALATDFGPAVTEIIAPAAREAELAELVREATTDRRRVIQAVLARAEAEGRLRPPTVETAIDLALGAVYLRHLITHEPLDRPFVDAVVDSLVAPPPG